MKLLICFICLQCTTGVYTLKNNELSKVKISSSAFAEGTEIPARYTCDAQNFSPPLRWENKDTAVKSIAIICEDPETRGGVWVHWLMYHIPSSGFRLPEAIPNKARLADGSLQGMNSFGQIGYGGPCPPTGTHHYQFRVFLLDREPDLPPGVDRKGLFEAMQGHILSEGLLTGSYSSKRKRTNIDGF